MLLNLDFRAYGFHQHKCIEPRYEFMPQLLFRPERVWFIAEPGAFLESLVVEEQEQLVGRVSIEYLMEKSAAPRRELPVGVLFDLEFERGDRHWGYALVLPAMRVGYPFSLRWSGTVSSFLVGGSQVRS